MTELEQIRAEIAELREAILAGQQATFNGIEAAAYLGICRSKFALMAKHIPRTFLPEMSDPRYSRASLDAFIVANTEVA